MSTTTSAASGDTATSRRAIEDLIITYAMLVDEGDFAGVGALFDDATIITNTNSVSGSEAVEKVFRDMLITYADGSPCTNRVTTNILVQVEAEIGTASSRSCFTVTQGLPDFRLQVICAGRYHDQFVKRAGKWRFVERRLSFTSVGDMSRHLRVNVTTGAA
ncbi:nuclear transport factor 2 family protein [Bradyrhizobium liaoningense]|uniref:nuclear transport factor 2 family protein n=1 Tax=Bradyrhizobium liaoningense TaxID=43992 RepID=UPI001BABCE35|nr:nuclear transport factor 2 family protein [Bradyrhizobium liaoningense]MBR0908261.1 nuclear transport factor 2 family protein [Bradyrhizobium liaoningense]